MLINLEYFAIGTYTEIVPHAPKACGDGVVIISLDIETGDLEIVSTLSDIKNPSYLHWSPTFKKLFVSSENDGESPVINMIVLDDKKNMIIKESVANSGKVLCHLNFDDKTENLYSVSYNYGCFYKYSVLDSGETKTDYKHSYTGSGPNTDRQEAPHAHQVVISQKYNCLYVPDLGSDKVWIHNSEKLDNIEFLDVPAGYGPRHLVIDRDKRHLFILCELEPVILVARINSNGTLKIIDELSTVEDDNKSISAPAAIKIHPSGNSLVCTNRFDDTIAVFNIDRADENNIKLNMMDIFTSGGNAPRDIEFSKNGDWLIITNQDSSNINIRGFDKRSGLPLSNWGNTLQLGTPVCIVNI